MHFLIDGYNLLHALGLAPKTGRPSLERARLRMLDWLSGELGSAGSDVSLIFDSARTRGDPEQVHRGLHVRFSAGPSADDLIEQLIRDEQRPARLTVVSNDNRLQQAALRRGCVSWTCGEYLDWLYSRHAKKEPAPPADEGTKPDAPTGVELDEWLKFFGN